MDVVGFQARFQTAGNLIFKPETRSSLNVTGTPSRLLQINKGSIKIMMPTIKLRESRTDKNQITSITQDCRRDLNEINKNGKRKDKNTKKKKIKGCIIKKYSWTIKKILMGTSSY